MSFGLRALNYFSGGTVAKENTYSKYHQPNNKQ